MVRSRCVLQDCLLGCLILAGLMFPALAEEAKFPPKTGVETPGIQHPIDELPPVATFVVKGHPDWLAVTGDAVWVASSNVNHVVKLDANTNQPGTIVTIAKPCSGMAVGFG